MTNQTTILYQTTTQTPLGQIVIIADQNYVYLVKFSDTPNLDNITQKLCKTYHAILEQGPTKISAALKTEFQLYFNGQLKKFTIPLYPTGTSFQKQAWEQLRTINYGESYSYSQQAASIKKTSAARAVARANASNLIAIMIPCHRIIGKNGKTTGYNGGMYRKEWLLNHEQKNK